MLGDALCSFLLGRSQEEWDTVLLQVLAYRSTPHTSTGKTPKLLMLSERLGYLTTSLTMFLSMTTLSVSMPVNC